MKFALILMFLTTLQIFGTVYSQSTRLTLDLKNASMSEVLKAIETQSEFKFLYYDALISTEKNLNIKLKDKTIEEILDYLLASSNNTYSILENNLVVVSRKEIELKQEISVTGKVTSGSTGESLPGVNITIKGTTEGTITNIDGEYTINVPGPEAILVFSYVGYISEEVTVGDQKHINMILAEDIMELDELVVIGYGAVKKSDLTGSVSSVKSEELMANAPISIYKALQGKAAGVLITSGNRVNSTTNIRIRGNRSIGATNDPLFVVDGFPMTGGLDAINPSDIESIEILKDASATAIYGARGANGVILVTTKKGITGKAVVEYNTYFSIGKLDRFRRARNAGEYCDYVREGNRSYIYDGEGGYEIDPSGDYSTMEPNYDQDLGIAYFTQDPYLLESLNQGWESGVWDPSSLRGFDWQMAGFRDYSSSQSHNLSVRGGTENTKYYVSAAYLDLEDIELQSFRKRYNLHLNIDQNLGERVSMGGSVDYSYLDWNDGKTIPIFWNPLGTPWNSPNDDITLDGDPAYGLIEHPCGEPLQYNSFYDLDGVIKQKRNNNLTSNFFVDINIFKGLTYRAKFGASLYLYQEQEFFSHFSTVTGLGNARATDSIQINRGWNFENILSYNKEFNNQSLNFTFVQSNEKFIAETSYMEGNDLPFEHQLWNDLGAASTQSVITDYSQWTMMSWLWRVNYNLLERYLLTASLRYDGASRLSEGHKWVAFPSVALGWRISQENFLKNSKVISNLKLRIGYGRTGNSAVDPYSTEGQIIASRYNWGKEDAAYGYAPYTLSNKALTWETTEQYNIGLDFGILKGRISGSIDMYTQHTNNLLMSRSLPSVSGFTSIMQNIGETENKGIELGLNTTNIHSKKILWSTDFTFAVNKEEIVKLASGLTDDIANNWFVGYPIDTYFDYVAAPVVWGYSAEDMAEMARFNENRSNFAPGDLRLEDLDGDYTITYDDREIRGSKMPKWTISMANTFTYGPFDLYIFMYSAFGQIVYWNPGVSIAGRYNTYLVDYWTPTNTDTKWLAPHADMQMPSNIDAMYYWKGDFLKISDITLGYTLPNNLMSKAKIQKIRFYAKIQNPYMFTKFEGNDPEGAIAHQRNLDGEITTYKDAPFTMRTYLLGLNVTF